MKVKLTESAREFVSTLSEADLEKAVVTETSLESDDPAIRKKFEDHIKARFLAVGDKIRTATNQFKSEHPEYFD